MWKTAFKKFEAIWSAYTGYLPQIILGLFLNTLTHTETDSVAQMLQLNGVTVSLLRGDVDQVMWGEGAGRGSTHLWEAPGSEKCSNLGNFPAQA